MSDSRLEDLQHQFSERLRQHQGIVQRVASIYCWHPDDRADLAQEIVAQLWRAYPRFDEQRKFTTWMYRIALNVAISYVRNHTRRQKHLVELAGGDSEHPDPRTEQTGLDERVDLLTRFIDRQDPLNRALLLLYLEEHSYREIARVLGISETNVATKLNRLKQQVRLQSERLNPTQASR